MLCAASEILPVEVAERPQCPDSGPKIGGRCYRRFVPTPDLSRCSKLFLYSITSSARVWPIPAGLRDAPRVIAAGGDVSRAIKKE